MNGSSYADSMTLNSACPHCAAPVKTEGAFCCPGCEAAYGLIHRLGLARYYTTRLLRDDAPRPTPEEAAELSSAQSFVRTGTDGVSEMFLTVEGLHCGACVWLIEQTLSREEGVLLARLNMTTRRLQLRWSGAAERGGEFIARIAQLGYRARPWDVQAQDDDGARECKTLLRALAVAGFATGNIMLLSVALWSSSQQEMGVATRDLLHWISALIALPTLVYAGRPFFRSAWAALSRGRGNMDVPISLALVGAMGMSLLETITHGEHAYFDSATMLLFFLLTGRYLDRRARGAARGAAANLLSVMATAATVVENGAMRIVSARDIAPGMRLSVASGERLAADGVVEEGNSALDTSLITGESLPHPVKPGDTVHGGMVNMGAPLILRVTATREQSLLAEIVRLMEQAQQSHSHYVRIADRVARYYTPVVHLLGLLTFLYWWLVATAPWQEALLAGITVLIITCPCALALAVPAVQVVASGRLFRRGILLKSGDALERLAAIDMVAFDKTGTLTPGRAQLKPGQDIPPEVLAHAASLATRSRHPLARALAAACPDARPAPEAQEIPGQGIVSGERRLGRREFAAPDAPPSADDALELWWSEPGTPPVRLAFTDPPRADAAQTISLLKAGGLRLLLLSGDREEAVREVAATCGIDDWKAALRPDDKLRALEALQEEGRRVLMVGDGLNDAPALATASVSMSPAEALDITRNAADIVFQGTALSPVGEAWRTARRSQTLVRQNIAFSLLYNVVAVPLAMAGYITPLAAAAAMSSSSLVVILNALRQRRQT